MGREDAQYREDWYWAIGDIALSMTPFQADIIRALRLGGFTWRGIMAVAVEELKWDIDETQMAGEQLCMLAAEILGHKSSEFDDDPEQGG